MAQSNSLDAVVLSVLATSGLEKASWLVAIAGFGLIILQLTFYWFGRHFPLKVCARGEVERAASGGSVLRIVLEFRSRTRDTQTVREVVLVEQVSLWEGLCHPVVHKRRLRAAILDQPGTPLPKSVGGHDTEEIIVGIAGDKLPYGKRTRIKVRASQRRPHFARVRLKQ